MGAYDSRRRVPIKQVYKSLVELQRFSTFRMFRMVGAVTVTTILACVLRLLFNNQEPFSFRIADMLGNDFNHTFQLGEETLCFYLAIMCDDVSYVVSLRRS